MSNNYTPLNSITEGKVDKPEYSEDIGPALLPQTPKNEVSNQNSTPNYLVQATPVRENKNNSIVSPPKEPLPKGMIKARVYSFILLGVCLTDLLIHIFEEIKSTFTFLVNVLCIIYSIILFFILFSSKIDLTATWLKWLVSSMASICSIFGLMGYVFSQENFLHNHKFNREQMEAEALWIFYFISIIIIKIAVLVRIAILIISFDFEFCCTF